MTTSSEASTSTTNVSLALRNDKIFKTFSYDAVPKKDERTTYVLSFLRFGTVVHVIPLF